MDTTVGRFSSRSDAEMAGHLLMSGGIPARVRADDVAALHPELSQMGMSGGITLVIAPEHLQDARELLASIAPSATVDRPPEGAEGRGPGASRRRSRAGASRRRSRAGASRRRSRAGAVVAVLVIVIPVMLFLNAFDVLTGG